MLPIVAGIVANLIENGMHKVADQVVEKGVDAVQEKLGMELKPQGQATPEYNEFYDRMDHGTAKWMSWIPYYTTSETIGIPQGADYLVIDNRNIFTR